MLQFFGRGSAFADQHNAAFFREQGDLILLDCPGTAFQKVKHFNWSTVSSVYVLVTHTHGDHIGGLGTLIASMASLISYKQYALTPQSEKGKYMLVFTGWNVVFLVILWIVAAVFY